MKKNLLLITSAPHHPAHQRALQHAQSLLETGTPVSVFFYGDGCMIANRLAWQSADVKNLGDAWAVLAQTFSLPLPVCVSAALARGVTDLDNAKRHNLDGENLRAPFKLVGLSELALQWDENTHIWQF